MALQPLAQRVLVSHARSESFVAKTVAILGRLGYRILDASVWNEGEGSESDPELLILDEIRQDDLAESAALARFAELPRVLLTSRNGVRVEAPEVVAVIRRPAGLHDLYRVIQQLFEDTPRTTPRVPTDIAVHCERRGDRFDATLLSISENGGLLGCEAELPLGASFEMSLELPGSGSLAFQAEAAYRLVPNIGVVFSSLAPGDRDAIGSFVGDILLGEA